MISETRKKIRRVAFFGDGSAKRDDKHFVEAKKVAKLLAENGYIVVNGGGPGVMLASTLGAKEGGGKVETVVLNPKKEPGNYEGIDKSNMELADKVYTANNYQERMAKLVEIADAFVVFKGGAGTLSEVGLTWEMAKFEYGRHEPLIFFGKCWKKIVKEIINNLEMEEIEQDVVETTSRPAKVLEILKRVNR